MSKDSDFTRHFIESNEVFSEAARVLQGQIDKIGIRLESLDKDLKNARSQLKTKDLEILRLNEIIKTYGKQKHIQNPELTDQLREAINEIKGLSESFKSSPIKESSTKILGIEEDKQYSIRNDEEFNSLVKELEKKQLEIQNLQQEKADLIEQESIFKSKIELLEKNIESMTELKEFPLLNDLQKKYDNALNAKAELEAKVQELENELKTERTISSDEDGVSSLKNEVSKYIQENISLNEKIESSDNLQKKILSQSDEIKSLQKSVEDLEEENNLLQKTVNYKEERERELLKSLEDLQQEHDLLQQTVNIKEKHEKELLSSLEHLQQEHDLLQKTVNIKEDHEKELLSSVEHLQQEHDLLEKTVNIKEDREKELLKNVTFLEQKIDALTKENSVLIQQISEFKNQVNHQEEEILGLKIQSNQLEENLEDLTDIEKESENFSEMEKDTFELANDELLLKISELEMEEANWKDERTQLLSKLQELEMGLKLNSNEGSLESIQKKDSVIKSLRNEILELNQDLDDADAEIKELEIENGLLRDKVSQIDSQTIEQKTLTTDLEDNEDTEHFIYEIKQKDSMIEEYSTRLKSQEQKILHLESLMEQERELKEKFEFLYNKMKNQIEQTKNLQGEELKDARKQFEQVIRSLNQSSKIMNLSSDEEEENDEEHSSQPKSSFDELSKALENANLYVSLIDKFLKPHVQITQLLKQGTWELNSLADIIGVDKKTLLQILQELKEKKILQYDATNVWLVSNE